MSTEAGVPGRVTFMMGQVLDNEDWRSSLLSALGSSRALLLGCGCRVSTDPTLSDKYDVDPTFDLRCLQNQTPPTTRRTAAAVGTATMTIFLIEGPCDVVASDELVGELKMVCGTNSGLARVLVLECDEVREDDVVGTAAATCDDIEDRELGVSDEIKPEDVRLMDTVDGPSWLQTFRTYVATDCGSLTSICSNRTLLDLVILQSAHSGV